MIVGTLEFFGTDSVINTYCSFDMRVSLLETHVHVHALTDCQMSLADMSIYV